MERNTILIKLNNIKFGYPGLNPLFNELNFEVSKGAHIGIIGPNGCGKTTLFNIIMGFVKPSFGDVEIFGKCRKTENDFQEVRQRIGYLFQNSDDQLFCPSVREEIAFGLLNYRILKQEIEKRIQEVLRLMGLEGFEERAPYHLSAGEKKRLAIATVLAMKPEILFFDEPTNELDESGINSVIEILHNNMTYIIISQDINFLKKTVSTIYTIEKEKLKEINLH
ncbi:MAG: energy-coupling factor ABC transporter ATP-binding protein [bacterium]